MAWLRLGIDRSEKHTTFLYTTTYLYTRVFYHTIYRTGTECGHWMCLFLGTTPIPKQLGHYVKK